MKIKFEPGKVKERILKVYKKIGKKNIVMGCCVLLIVSAICLNVFMFSDEAGIASDAGTYGYYSQLNNGTLGESALVDETLEDETKSYFAMTQVNRQRARDEAMEVLQLVVDSEETLQDVKDKAVGEITQIAADIENEAAIEALVVSKGFEECVAVINGNNINIVVKSDELLPNEIAQISEIAYQVAGINPTQVKIIEKN